MSLLRRARAPFGIAVTLFGSVLVASTIRGAASDEPAAGSVLVAQTPRADTPIVLDGRVNANVQFGGLIVLGGEFTLVQTNAGTVLDRPNLVAYDIETGAVVESFDPVIDGEIFALEAADDGSGLFVGGTFNTVDGAEHRKLVKLTATGEVDPSFVVSVDARVQTIDDDGRRVYFGGSFSAVNGETRLQLAAVDIGTGALSTLRADVTESLGFNGGGSVRAVDVHPSGNTLLVAHASARVAGQPRVGVAQIDLTTDQLTDWRTDWYTNAHSRCADGGALSIRDAEYSPNGDAFYVVEKGHYECDKVISFPTANGPGLEQNLWVTQMYDSSLSVGPRATRCTSVATSVSSTRLDQSTATRQPRTPTSTNPRPASLGETRRLRALRPAIKSRPCTQQRESRCHGTRGATHSKASSRSKSSTGVCCSAMTLISSAVSRQADTHSSSSLNPRAATSC